MGSTAVATLEVGGILIFWLLYEINCTFFINKITHFLLFKIYVRKIQF